MADETTAEFDTETIAQGWAQLADRRPTHQTELAFAARTDIGRVRENNEDKYDFFTPDDAPTLALRGRLWAIADGMGGHSAGQIASEAGLKCLIRSYFAEPVEGSVADALQQSLADANFLISQAAIKLGAKNGMGTTMVAAVVLNDMLTIAHVGDSRAYLLREGERIRQLTIDHSWVEEQVRRGALSRAEAEASPYRNIITRSIGMGPGLTADIYTERLFPDDTILLATDGVTGYLGEDALAALVGTKSLSKAALDIIDAANDAGGKDNSTVLLLRVSSITPLEPEG
ncbi:protein phosphatase 2C domain-containing protein [Armatimonas rosea]|uniref:Protein phosphatase n=1 Tax=Armatimonas rosea TaxID=685828 RepID=A0A7W9W5L6_ARMRO|nr:PP2C family serine/threonine-protein phosphatase [Armatimonas rosea]MBB6049035.1 protein phosphatase [Armatimonas rosea]